MHQKIANQNKFVGIDPQLSYNIIPNELRKVSSDIHESNTDFDDDAIEDNSAILHKLTFVKHHVVMKENEFEEI